MNHAEACPASKPLACTVETAALQPSWLNCAGKCFDTDGKEGTKEKTNNNNKKNQPNNQKHQNNNNNCGNNQENYIHVYRQRNKCNKLCIRQGPAFIEDKWHKWEKKHPLVLYFITIVLKLNFRYISLGIQ